MAKVKYTRINLFNTLVCPDEVTNGEWAFKDWCQTLQTEAEYLAQRSYLLLDFYSAFRKIYNFFCSAHSCLMDNEDSKLRKLYCEFPSDDEMVITIKYKHQKEIDESYYDAISTYFDTDPGDSYDEFDMEPPCESHNSVKLIFRKKG